MTAHLTLSSRISTIVFQFLFVLHLIPLYHTSHFIHHEALCCLPFPCGHGLVGFRFTRIEGNYVDEQWCSKPERRCGSSLLYVNTLEVRANICSLFFYLTVMTNEPSGNFVVTADIQSDGKLALFEAVSTRGIGIHGQVQNPGPDPLFSQGAVKASANGRVLAVVNVGCYL
jgi:hypothetical protein